MVCHVVSFMAIYFGRLRGVAICHSDIFLFNVPFILAGIGYGFVFARLIVIHNVWLRGVFVGTASIFTAIISEVIGMTITFNLWGT